MAKSTLKSYMNNTVWPSFARMIKARDSDNSGICICCTCNKSMSWNDPECQAGHLVPSRCANVLFDVLLVHAQCSRCNNYNGGAVWEYTQFMRKKYGMTYEEIDELFARKHVIKKYTKDELKELKKSYDEDFNQLCKQKGLVWR